MRSRPLRRRRRIRSATCRSASSARSSICTVLYILVSAVLTGMVPYPQLDVAAPVALALDRASANSPGSRGSSSSARSPGMTSVMLVMLLGQPRIFYAMSRDGLLPPLFRRVHPKYQTPYVGTLITGASRDDRRPVPSTSSASWCRSARCSRSRSSASACSCLRYTRPDLPRPFRVPAPWLICVARRADLRRHDGLVAAGHLGATARLDRDRVPDLCRSTAISTAHCARP